MLKSVTCLHPLPGLVGQTVDEIEYEVFATVARIRLDYVYWWTMMKVDNELWRMRRWNIEER